MQSIVGVEPDDHLVRFLQLEEEARHEDRRDAGTLVRTNIWSQHDETRTAQ